VFVTGLFQFLASPIGGVLARRGYSRQVLTAGILMMAASCYQFSHLTWEWDFWEMLVPQMLRGAGLMFCMIPANVIALGRLEPETLKDASGLYNLLRNLGGALGLAVLNTQLIERSSIHYQQLSERVSAGRGVAEAWLAGLGERYNAMIPGEGQFAALKTLNGFVHREAAVLAFADCFWIIMCIYLVALLATPLVRPPANTDVPEEP
jgi:DHA2 family multidrug resistance protein